MAVIARDKKTTQYVDKNMARRILAEQARLRGDEVIPNITVQQLRAMMIEEGVKPEDNAFSQEVIRMRDEL